MKPLALAACVVCLTPAAAFAQQRVLSDDAPGVLRAWPPSGKFLVTMSRAPDGALYCAIGTGRRNGASAENYVWGLRWREAQAALFISDANAHAIDGGFIKIAVDGVAVGDFPVSQRRQVGEMASIDADIPPAEARRLLDVLRVGATAAFATAHARYTVPLAGASAAVAHVDQCNAELGRARAAAQ